LLILIYSFYIASGVYNFAIVIAIFREGGPGPVRSHSQCMLGRRPNIQYGARSSFTQS